MDPGDQAECAQCWPPCKRSSPAWGAKSFADDLGLSRGIVRSRAVPLLRSPEIHLLTLAFVHPGRDPVPSTVQGSILDIEIFGKKNWRDGPEPCQAWHPGTGQEAQGSTSSFDLTVKNAQRGNGPSLDNDSLFLAHRCLAPKCRRNRASPAERGAGWT